MPRRDPPPRRDLADRHGRRARPRGGPDRGATEFVEALKASGLRFLVLTNNSIFTPRDLRARLLASGIDVPEEAIWTSALATAQFLATSGRTARRTSWGRPG